jgi:hypothetical protein
MRPVLQCRVNLTLEAEVTVAWLPEGAGTRRVSGAATRWLLETALADPAARSFFIRQAAVMPFVDWPGSSIETGLEWLQEGRQHFIRVIGQLPPEHQIAFQAILDRQTDEELDDFLAAFQVRYRALTVEVR